MVVKTGGEQHCQKRNENCWEREMQRRPERMRKRVRSASDATEMNEHYPTSFTTRERLKTARREGRRRDRESRKRECLECELH